MEPKKQSGHVWKRAYELSEMQASMFMGKIYSGDKELLNNAANDSSGCKENTEEDFAWSFTKISAAVTLRLFYDYKSVMLNVFLFEYYTPN